VAEGRAGSREHPPPPRHPTVVATQGGHGVVGAAVGSSVARRLPRPPDPQLRMKEARAMRAEECGRWRRPRGKGEDD
jgi:hypothetical protein